jgi:hypothetical protein
MAFAHTFIIVPIIQNRTVSLALARIFTTKMENYRDDRSSTAKDSDTESVSLEKDGLLGTAPRLGKMKVFSSRLYPLLIATMAIANVIIGVLLVLQFQSSHQKTTPHQHEKNPTPVPIGGLPHVESHPDWLPPEDWRTEVFRLHQIYGEEPVGTAKEAWLSLIPSKEFLPFSYSL